MSVVRPFSPVVGGTLTIACAITASTPAALPVSATDVALFNSGTAIAFVRIANVPANTDAGSNATLNDYPVPPGGRTIVSPGPGYKWISVIASAANGNLYASPGVGGV